jgi:predicted RNA-binding protein with PUA-like domain
VGRRYFLLKSEPSKYPFEKLVADGRTAWDGVRNFEARNNLRQMGVDDQCLFYHSNEGKAVVGIARVVREAYQDPTTPDDWSAVDIEPVRALARSVTLSELRGHRVCSKMAIFRRARLSVVPVTAEEFRAVVDLGKTKA